MQSPGGKKKSDGDYLSYSHALGVIHSGKTCGASDVYQALSYILGR